jgi:hypothetical protein
MSYTLQQADKISFFKRLRFRFLSFFRNDFFSYRHTKRPLAAALLVNIILWGAIIIKTRLETRPIPLHFSSSYGIELVGPAFWLAELPLVGLLLLGLNVFLAKRLYADRVFLAAFLNYVSLLVQLSVFLAAIAIIVLNF